VSHCSSDKIGIKVVKGICGRIAKNHSIDSGGSGIYESKIVIHPDRHQIEFNWVVLSWRNYTRFILFKFAGANRSLPYRLRMPVEEVFLPIRANQRARGRNTFQDILC